MAAVSMKDLLEAGVHFGHRTRRWNPRMRPYIFTERSGIHIIDLQQTLAQLNTASKLVRDTVAKGGTVLFVGTKRQAQATIQAARTLQALRPSGAWRDRDLAAYEARFCARQGNWLAARQLLKEAETEESHPLSELMRAEIALVRQRPDAAEALLTHFVAQYPAGFPNESSLDARVMLAHALFARHKMNQARRVLVEAVQLAAPEGFIRPFLDHGCPLTPLLALIRHTGNLSAESDRFIGEILNWLGRQNDAPCSLEEESLDSLATAASITAREQTVLKLLCEGLSNSEIAGKLCVSPGTVKTHLANIYDKLGVKSRVQAVAEAQALKLI